MGLCVHVYLGGLEQNAFLTYVEERFNRFPRVLGGLFSVFCFHILEGIVYG